MEFEYAYSCGWLQYEYTLAMTTDEVRQLRLALSLAKAHGVDVSIVDTLLVMTDDV